MMIFRLFPIFRYIDAPWWPNTEINITEMKYPDTFHDTVQYFENKHGRKSAILEPPDPNFGLEERITQIHMPTKYNTNMSAGNENFPIMSTDDGRRTPDYGRKLNAIAHTGRWPKWAKQRQARWRPRR